MTTSEQIRTLRTKADLTQVQLAEKLEVKQQKVSEWENGKHEPKHSTFQQIVKICKSKK